MKKLNHSGVTRLQARVLDRIWYAASSSQKGCDEWYDAYIAYATSLSLVPTPEDPELEPGDSDARSRLDSRYLNVEKSLPLGYDYCFSCVESPDGCEC